jgi:kynurenine formamidase
MNEYVHNLVWLSYPIDASTPSYGNGERFATERIKCITEGDSCNTSRWQFPNHIGTHIDAPNHFFSEGDSIDEFPPEYWNFSKVAIIKKPLINENMCIGGAKDFINIPKETDLILIYTGFCHHRNEEVYWNSNPGLSSELAVFLRENFPNLRAIGIDSISISSWQNREEGRKAHKIFLDPDYCGTPVLLIEDMDLSILEENIGITYCCVLPVRVKGADGSPCTIFADVKKC